MGFDLDSDLDTCRVAVFDCDGVLLDSNPVKLAAFRVALADEDPARVEVLLGEHLRTGGVSRFAKLERFYREIQPVEDPEIAIAVALRRFSDAAREGLRTCSAIAGVEALLSRLSGQGTAIHVISGGEQDEVREALLGRGWGGYFAGIHGSPTRKRDHMAALRERGSLPIGALAFGDAELDVRLAEEFGLRFVFVAGASDWPAGRESAAARGHAVIEDFTSASGPG
ncbi:HAD family hydrolase [Nannocystaceae bacterium ST9]